MRKRERSIRDEMVLFPLFFPRFQFYSLITMHFSTQKGRIMSWYFLEMI